MEKNFEQVFSYLLEQDLLQRLVTISVETKEAYVPVHHVVDPQSYHREKELLLKSLREHTREKIRWEDVLDNRWKEARNNCAKIVPKLQKETRKLVNNFLDQERQTNLLPRGKGDSAVLDRAVEEMGKAMLNAIWQGIREDNLEQNLVQLIPSDMYSMVKVKNEAFLVFKDTSLADKVIHILCKGEMVESLRNEVRKMKKASEELHEMLNPVKLRPMILRTRCDLCPA